MSIRDCIRDCAQVTKKEVISNRMFTDSKAIFSKENIETDRRNIRK